MRDMLEVYLHEFGVILPNGEFWGCHDAGHAWICRQILDIKRWQDEDALKGTLLLMGELGCLVEGYREGGIYHFTDAQVAELENILRVENCPELLKVSARMALEDNARSYQK